MRKKILIGPMNRNDVGSIPTLNRAFVNGLGHDYNFVPAILNRKYGKTSLAKFNIVSLWYFVKQYFNVVYLSIKHKPQVFHYALTSYWNFEKSLVFLNSAKIFGAKKVVAHLHGGSFDKFISNLKGPRKKIGLKLLSRLDAILVASSYWKDFLTDLGVETNIHVVNNPIDSAYLEALKNKSIGSDQRNNRFLFVGALGKRKGFYDLIEASKSLEGDFFLDAFGNEDKKNDLSSIRELIDTYGVSNKFNIILSEKMSIEEKANFFSKSGVFLFPSHNENFPLVIIEAASAGMPIVSTRVGAVPEFFKHMESIYFVNPGNIDEIKKAINFMMNNPEERVRLGNGAKEVYDSRLDQKIIMNQLKEAYELL